MERILPFSDDHKNVFKTAFCEVLLLRKWCPYYNEWEDNALVSREVFAKNGKPWDFLCPMGSRGNMEAREQIFLYSVYSLLKKIARQGCRGVFLPGCTVIL